MSKTLLGVRIPSILRELLEEEARQRGESLSKTVRRRLDPFGSCS